MIYRPLHNMYICIIRRQGRVDSGFIQRGKCMAATFSMIEAIECRPRVIFLTILLVYHCLVRYRKNRWSRYPIKVHLKPTLICYHWCSGWSILSKRSRSDMRLPRSSVKFSSEVSTGEQRWYRETSSSFTDVEVFLCLHKKTMAMHMF